MVPELWIVDPARKVDGRVDWSPRPNRIEPVARLSVVPSATSTA
jgi:hypothetical protein